MPDRRSNRPLVFLALAAAIGLSGCNRPDDTANTTAMANSTAPLPALPATLPMTTGAATPAAYAPAVTALPAARPIRAVRVANSGEAYAYADDAYAFSHAVGNAPPDYGFAYQGAEPWAWQGYDESRTFVEPVSGGYRYYYYRPGADTPYFVRDPDYGYGYDDGSIAVIYSAGGAIIPYADYGPRLGYASRYLRRGEDLYQASLGNERRAVNAANWAARQDSIAASRDRWAAAQAQQAGWQAYRARAADQQAQHWAQEAARRDADARRFATWHDDGFRSAPPPRAIPAAWQQAPWAQNQQRYRVADRAQESIPQPPPGFERPVGRPQPDQARGGIGPQGVPLQFAPSGQAQPQRRTDPRNVGLPNDVADQRMAQDVARHQADMAQAERQQAARAGEQRLQQAAAIREQQQAARAQQQQAVRQAQQADRQQRFAADRQQQDAERQAERGQQPIVRIHRGGDAPGDGGGPNRDRQRPQPAFQSAPPRDDPRQAERQQQQAQRQAQQVQAQQVQAQQMERQQQAAARQQQAPQQPHREQPPHVVEQPHPAAAPRPAPAPQQREEHRDESRDERPK